MIIKIGDKDFNFDGYANINEIAKAFDEALNKSYQQGKADKYKEIISEYMLLTEKQVDEIRADAFDDVERELLENGFIFTEHALEVWHGIVDKLKEQK